MDGFLDWWFREWKWALTTALAVYAAGISTYREVQSRQQWKPKLKVQLSLDIIAIYPEGTVPQVQVWVANHGRCDIHFNSNGVSLGVKGYEKALLVVDPRSNVTFPLTLKPGGSFYLMKEKAPLLEALRETKQGTSVEIRAFIFDALSRPFYSDWQVVSLAEKKASA